jgi:hypothetical protein
VAPPGAPAPPAARRVAGRCPAGGGRRLRRRDDNGAAGGGFGRGGACTGVAAWGVRRRAAASARQRRRPPPASGPVRRWAAAASRGARDPGNGLCDGGKYSPAAPRRQDPCEPGCRVATGRSALPVWVPSNRRARNGARQRRGPRKPALRRDVRGRPSHLCGRAAVPRFGRNLRPPHNTPRHFYTTDAHQQEKAARLERPFL